MAKVNIEADAGKVENPGDLSKIVALSRQMYNLYKDIEELEAELKKKADAYTQLRMITLPERMAACNLTSFSLGNGYSINIQDFISASIPTETKIEAADGPEREALVDRRNKAFAWLRANKADSLIKNELVAVFGKGEDKKAKKFFASIVKAGYPAKCEESVNHNTLNAFLREQLKAGVDIPSEPFNLFIGKKAEIKQAK